MLILDAKNLSQSPATAHGFFGRTGGVSTSIFASLNCGPGSGDDPAAVAENRKRAREALAATHLVTLYQIHSATAVTVTAPWETGPQADAMATRIPCIALGILTADCAPVLLVDSEAKIIGAAHAGWKGALAGVVEAAAEAMEKLGADRERISAAIGPCIAQANYEVGFEFQARFVAADQANDRFFDLSDRVGHYHFDLEGYVVHRLREAGIGDVEGLYADTYARESEFYSFRRATHRGETAYGRQISAIVLR
jgi:YfiH family protein